LYGMNTMKIDELIRFGRSWAYAPALNINGNGFKSNGYDRTQRCYQIENASDKPNTIEFTLDGTKESPVANPAIYIKNWNSDGAKVLVNGKPLRDCRIGINRELGGKDLVVFLPVSTDKRVNVSILPYE